MSFDDRVASITQRNASALFLDFFIPETKNKNRIRKEEHDRLQEMRLRHAEEMAAASRGKTAALASLARQAEMDREEWDKRAKEEASAVAEEVNPSPPHQARVHSPSQPNRQVSLSMQGRNSRSTL